MWRKSTGLMDYQQEVIDCKNDFIILNWCRNSSKTFVLAKLLQNKLPKNVIYVGHNKEEFYEFEDKIDTFTKLKIDYSNEMGISIFTSISGDKINLFSNTYDKLDKDLVYDYILYDDILPFNIGVKANKIISTISYNNYDKWLQRFFPTAKIFEKDHNDMMNIGLLNHNRMNNIYEINPQNYLNEYAILDNPFNREQNKVIIACDFHRGGWYGDISEMILKYDDKIGYSGYVINCSSCFRWSTTEDIKIKDKINYLRDEIISYNGKRAKDYENIDMVLINSGAGGSGIHYSDFLLEDWIDKEGINHVGLIDKTSDIYEGYENKFPNAIDKLRLISIVKHKNKMQEELISLLKEGVLQFDRTNENDVSKNINLLMLAHRLYELRRMNNSKIN